MAARKSCTHLTWADAKNNSGIGGSKRGGAKLPPKRENHGKVLAAKIVAKIENSSRDVVADRQAARRAKQDAQRQEQLNRIREQEKEQAKLQAVVQPYEQAQARIQQMSQEWQEASTATEEQDDDHLSTNTTAPDLGQIAECKQMQLEEVLALEAIYADTDTLGIANACRIDELRQLVEDWQEDESSEMLQKKIQHHPPISLALQLIVDHPDSENLAACILLQVTFTPLYPLYGQHPQCEWRIMECLVTDKTTECSSNKPLESLGYLQEEALQTQLMEQAQQLHTDPCVYELASMWFTEHLFDYIKLL